MLVAHSVKYRQRYRSDPQIHSCNISLPCQLPVDHVCQNHIYVLTNLQYQERAIPPPILTCSRIQLTDSSSPLGPR